MVSQRVEKADLVTVTQNLLKEFGERLYNTALRLCANPSDAEDLTFRTFEQAIRKFDTFRGEASVFSWLCSILVNFIRMDARRKAANALDFPGELPEVENEADVSAPMVISTAEEASILRRAVRELPLDLREVVVMYYFNGMEAPEVGRALGLPEGTVHSRLNRARKSLRQKISRRIGR